MRLTISALLLGAASSVVALPSQVDKSFGSVSHGPFNYKSIDLDFTPSDIKPKKSTRRPASFWDHVVDGADIQQDTHHGVNRRKLDGELSNYSLRVKANDPSSLGVDKVKQYSGYLDDDANDKHLFYWFFESRNDPKNDPVVLWLNGGPGCSSMVGLFDELGPAKIPGSDLKPVSNPSSWNSNASVIFLDQPVNVGYSYSGKSVSTTAAASKDVYALLTLFFTQFPEYAEQNFHISGESYAGHYIPIFAAEILSHQDRNINLKSVLIGNGLTDPLTQYNYYRPMACGEGGYPSVLPKSTCDSMDKALPQCEKYIQACYDNPTNAGTCSTATSYCNNNVLGPYQRSGRSVYDIRINDGDGTPSYADQFLNSQKVRDAVGAEVSSYDECNGGINGAFSRAGDWMQPIQRAVPKLLEKIPVLIYAGDADYICNWLGNRAWTNALQWPGSTAFKNAQTQSLKFPDSTEYGKVKTAQGLTFIQIYKAGHMVPSDQPRSALDFFNRAIGGEWFKK